MEASVYKASLCAQLERHRFVIGGWNEQWSQTQFGRVQDCTGWFTSSYAQVAQSVEQWIENPRVGGSIPPLGTITVLPFFYFPTIKFDLTPFSL